MRAIAKDPAERFSSASALTAAIAEAFHLLIPAGLFPPTYPSNALTYLSPHQSGPSITAKSAKQYQTTPVNNALPQPAPVSAVKFPASASPWRTWKGKLIACIVVLCVLAGSTITSLHVLYSGHASPPLTVGTLTFASSGQYDSNTTVGYNDVISLSLHGLSMLGAGKAYFAWLMPDQGDDGIVPLLLGRLSVNKGNATLHYVSPAHANLLAQYSGVRVTEQQALADPSSPSQDPKTWRWDGWIAQTPSPGDENHYSFLSHVRHLLANDPTLVANALPGGLVIWMTRNVSKVEEWSSAAQGSWGDGDIDLVHRHLIRILDYLDGQSYVWQDVPAESPWLVDPLAGKFGLLSYTQNQQPPGYLQHVDIHLKGLEDSPGHTEEQKNIAIQVDNIITRMINDLAQVRKDAVQLVQRNDAQLRQPDTLMLLNEMVTLTTEVNSGWFDSTTHENLGETIWLNAQVEQEAAISLETSSQM